MFKLARLLFGNDDPYRYTPKPWHLIYAVLLMAMGTVSFGYEWYFFGTFCAAFGVLLGLTIIIGLNWDKSIEYWRQIEWVMTAAAKIKDTQTRYELLKSMGYNVPVSSITITELEEDRHGNLLAGNFNKLPVPSVIMQTIADKILMSGDPKFPVEDSVLGKSIPNYRKVKKYFLDKKYIVKNHATNSRLGHSFNKTGIKVLYEFASEGVKLELKRKEGDRNE